MICIAITLILIGCSPVIGQEVFDESGEFQSPDSALEDSGEIFRLKIPADEVEDPSSEVKTIKNDEEYDVGKILSHLQIVHRPRPVIDLRPSGGHTVIHKNNKDQHASHHDEYIPVKLSSDTEYVIKPLSHSHSNHHHGKPVVKPESHDHYYNKPEYSNHGANNHGYDGYGYYNHGNEYNHGHGHKDHGHDYHGYNNYYGHDNHEHGNHVNGNHGYNSHEHDNHGYNSDKYPHQRPTYLDHYHGKPEDHHNHGSHNHPSRPHIESHVKPHFDYKPHHEHGNNGYHQDHKYGSSHENYHDEHKPYRGGNKHHHQDHKPYNHDNYGYLHHKYNEKPYSGYDSHHHNHRPHHNGYEYHSYFSHDKPHHNYEVHEEEDNSHHKPPHNHQNHKPHRQHHNGHHVDQQSPHKPSKNVYKPSESGHKPHRENNHYKPHSDPHKGQSNIQGSLWKPYISGVNTHKTDKHKEKPKNYQLQHWNEQIRNDLQSFIDIDKDEAATYMEKLDSDSNVHKNTSNNHTTSPKPEFSQIKANSTNVGTINSLGDTSKPNKSTPMITQTNTENTLKPHQMTSFEKPKPILASSTSRPIISTNHGSGTHSNFNKHDQKPHHIAQKPQNSYYNPEHNFYEVTETLLSSNHDSSSSEENSNLQHLILKPSKGESSEVLVDNSQEQTSSYGNNLNNPYSSTEYAVGEQFNIQEENHQDQYLQGSEHEQYLPNQEGSAEISGEDNHETHPPKNTHQSYHSYPYHGNNPHRHQSHPQKASYNHYNVGPNSCDSSFHEQKLQDYHKEIFRPSYDQQSSHSNHHNYYGKPVNNHHTHQVSKPFNIDHGGPYGGVSGIFINNFKKRPSSWYNDEEKEYIQDNREILGGGYYEEDYREKRDNYREERAPFESNIEGKREENYLNRLTTSENSHKKLFKVKSRTSENISDKPNSRRNHHTGSDIYEKTPRNRNTEIFFTNIKDKVPLTSGYYPEDKENKETMYEAEKALAYVMNPYAYVSRPHHNGLQYSTHQNFIVNPNHHQQSAYNHVQPHHEHQSNHHDHGTHNPHYHYSQEVETHSLGYNPSSQNTGHHNAHATETFFGHDTGHHNPHISNHAHHGASHGHNSNEIPVKYVYIPVLYNFQTSSVHSPYLNTLSSNLKMNQSNAGYFNSLDFSGLDTMEQNQEQVVKPSLNFFRTPTQNSESIPVRTPQVTQESSTILLQLLNSPNLNTLSGNGVWNSRDGGDYLRKVEPLKRVEMNAEVENTMEKGEVDVETDKTPSTSNWHQTQELHEDYATQCKDIWDSILLAQETGTKKQERSLSKSNEEVTTAFQDLKKKVESLMKNRKRSNTLESRSDQDLKDSLESTCIEVLKNALLAQLEILDIKRREELNKNQSQTMNKLEADKENVADTVSEATDSAVIEVETDEDKKEDLPIIFEKEQVGLDDTEDEQDNSSFSQDNHW